MRRITAILTVLTLATLATTATAERLELGLAVTPTWLYDKNYEAFSEDNLYLTRFGLDLRTEVGEISKFQFLPLLGYRAGMDFGMLGWDIDTQLTTHDVFAGLRVRREVLSWLTAFGEVQAGALFGVVSADISDYAGDYYDRGMGASTDYTDSGVTWSVGAIVGLETHLSRRWLESRGVDWFCFGGEIALGYLRRGDLTIDPTREGGDDNALPSESLGAWGDINLSGLVLQIGASFYFI